MIKQFATKGLLVGLFAASGVLSSLATAQDTTTTENTAAPQTVAAEDDRAYQMEHKFELAKSYFGTCEHTEAAEFDDIRPYLKGFTDVEELTQIMADPIKMTRMMRIVSDPRTINIMMKCSTEPVMWDTWMRGMTDVNKLLRSTLVFMDPMTYINWMMAPFRPEVYSAMFGIISPDNLGRWATALVNPTFYEPMYQPLVSASWYTPRINWLIDPQSYEPLIDMLSLDFGFEETTPQQ